MPGSTFGSRSIAPQATARGLVGYSWLLKELELRVLPPRHLTYLGTVRREFQEGGRRRLELPASYRPSDGLGAQLEFALRWDGVDLSVLAPAFRRIVGTPYESQLTEHIRSRPTGSYARRLWYLFELFTGRTLDIPNAAGGPVSPVLDEKEEFTSRGRRSPRHRVLDNLLGNAKFCHQVERTELLAASRTHSLAEQAASIAASYDEDTLRRATDYLYTKETRSSFAIEREEPSAARTQRFVQLLRETPTLDHLTKQRLIQLQRETVDPRFATNDWRSDQVYVGETLSSSFERVHYAAPKPEDVPDLMEGWLQAAERLLDAPADPIAQAAVLSFGFVFIHPFPDGNGRLHRLLLHAVLARTGFTPKGLILPVSAVMLARRYEYDATLEKFSRPLMENLEYELDTDLRMTISGSTADFYRYFDATPMAEALAGWLEETINVEFRRELDFITAFRSARQEMEEVVSMPERLFNLFVMLSLQNNGKLSTKKRETHFSMLRDDEVAALEAIVAKRLLPLKPLQ